MMGIIDKKMTIEKPRRNFLSWIWISLGFVAFAEVIAVCVTFFKPLKKEKTAKQNGQIIDAGVVEQFEPGSVTAFVRGRFYLVHLKESGFLAISSKCTHLGCTVPWDKDHEKFICPCHSSKFDITGKVLSSPAPRALDLYQVQITNKKILVDTSKKTKRNSFNINQVVYPDEIKVTKINA